MTIRMIRVARWLGLGIQATIIFGMLGSSGFPKYSTLLVIQLFSRRLCLCHCLCIRLCLCICVPNSFLNSYYHKLSENVWVLGCGATRSEIWTGVTIAGQPTKRTNNRTRKDRATQPMDHGRWKGLCATVLNVNLYGNCRIMISRKV